MNNLVKLGDDFIRTVEKDGTTWYALPDVLRALETKTDVSDMSKRLRHEVDGAICYIDITYGNGQKLSTNMVSATGLYYIIFKSKRPKARAIMPKLLEQIKDSKLILDALNDFEVPDELPDMYVYAIREQDSGKIKLGISKDPAQRLRTLQTGNSSKLELVAFRKAENRFKDEQELHKLAANEHVRGEWFEGSAVRLVA